MATKYNLPTFLGIGAQRTGTSWLYNQLVMHPDIWMTPFKEIHYFDRSLNYPSPNDLATSSPYNRIIGSNPWERPRTTAGMKTIYKNLAKGDIRKARWLYKWFLGYYNDEWYKGLFSQAKSYKACGEITPSYSILNNEDIARIKSLNPNIKIIFTIRDPIERAWSAIRFHIHRGAKLSVNSPDEIISVLKNPAMLLRGDYERTLENYLQYFDTSQILVCFYDAIKYDPTGLMSDIIKFLGVNHYRKLEFNNNVAINPSPQIKMPIKVKDYLCNTYDPMTRRLAKTFGSYANTWETRKHNVQPKRKYSPGKLAPTIHIQ